MEHANTTQRPWFLSAACILINALSCCSLDPGAFIIPYLVMVVACGIPLVFVEFTIGQYTSLGPVHAIARICPLFKGER